MLFTDEISQCFSQFLQNTVVRLRLHTIQLQLRCTMTDKTAAALLAQDRVNVSWKHVMVAELGMETKIVGGTQLEAEYWTLVLGNWWQIGSRWGKCWNSSQYNLLCSLGPSQRNQSKPLQFTWPSMQGEMATVDELVQMMNTLQDLEVDWKPTFQIGWLTRTGGDCDCCWTSSSDREFQSKPTIEWPSLVDIKGLRKHPAFKGESARFTEWLRKTTGFLIAAYGSAFQPVIEWVEHQDDVITCSAVEQQFGPLEEEPVDDDLDRKWKLRNRSWSSTSRSWGAATFGPSLGSSEWRKVQSTSASNPGSRSVQTARSSRRTRGVGRAGAKIGKKHIEKNDDNSSWWPPSDGVGEDQDNIVTNETFDHSSVHRSTIFTKLATTSQIQTENHISINKITTLALFG